MYDQAYYAPTLTDPEMVAGYVDHPPNSYPALVKAYPNAVHVSICIDPRHDADVLDCERYDANPDDCPGWALRQRQRGATPTVYCSQALWPMVRAAFAAAQVAEPHWWIANYNAGTDIPAGAVARQYRDLGAWDVSEVLDYWPGVDIMALDTDVWLSIIKGSPGNPYNGNIAEAFVADTRWLLDGLAPAVINGVAPMIADLKAQIAALIQQVDALQKATGGPTGTVQVTGQLTLATP